MGIGRSCQFYVFCSNKNHIFFPTLYNYLHFILLFTFIWICKKWCIFALNHSNANRSSWNIILAAGGLSCWIKCKHCNLIPVLSGNLASAQEIHLGTIKVIFMVCLSVALWTTSDKTNAVAGVMKSKEIPQFQLDYKTHYINVLHRVLQLNRSNLTVSGKSFRNLMWLVRKMLCKGVTQTPLHKQPNAVNMKTKRWV